MGRLYKDKKILFNKEKKKKIKFDKNGKLERQQVINVPAYAYIANIALVVCINTNNCRKYLIIEQE